jgi:hypothetical protein
MTNKTPRPGPSLMGTAGRAGGFEGFGDAFNAPDKRTSDPHQGTQASQARVEAGAATRMPSTGQARPGPRDGLAWRHLTPPGQTGLDAALVRLFPAIPDQARRWLRQPLECWRRAAVRYLRSQRTRTDADDFVACFWALPCPRAPWSGPSTRTDNRGDAHDRGPNESRLLFARACAGERSVHRSNLHR